MRLSVLPSMIVLVSFALGQNAPQRSQQPTHTAQQQSTTKLNGNPPRAATTDQQGGVPCENGAKSEQSTPIEKPEKPLISPEWANVIVAIIYVMVAFFTLLAIHRQANIAEKQSLDAKTTAETADKTAKAARDSADALINAERAWVFADIERAPGSGRDVSNGQTTVSVRVICNNVGRSPAWIDEILIRYFMAGERDAFPDTPDFSEAEYIHIGPTPIAPKGEPLRTDDLAITARGVQGLGIFEIAYGIVRYRDPFGAKRHTTFGYRLRTGDDMRYERLRGMPSYNEHT